ncbi:MAG: SAM-dependent methyltransferase [Bacteroidia bacterium]|nr:SAM-dependent methyltransferase [Bacteroidia bacterium]
MLTSGPTLYLLPNFIDEECNPDYLCDAEKFIIRSLQHFVTESKSALFTLLKKCAHPNLEKIQWIEFNEHHVQLPAGVLDLFKQKVSVGLVSDAGLPSMADPGYPVVRQAHLSGYKVVPLPGPGSVYMAIMASGLNAQCFVFHGYLPRENHALRKKLIDIQKQIQKDSYSHFFIETPYRNLKMFEFLLKSLPEDSLLSICAGLKTQSEFIKTLSISAWKKNNIPNIHKVPCVFGIGN